MYLKNNCLSGFFNDGNGENPHCNVSDVIFWKDLTAKDAEFFAKASKIPVPPGSQATAQKLRYEDHVGTKNGENPHCDDSDVIFWKDDICNMLYKKSLPVYRETFII